MVALGVLSIPAGIEALIYLIVLPKLLYDWMVAASKFDTAFGFAVRQVLAVAAFVVVIFKLALKLIGILGAHHHHRQRTVLHTQVR
jgi:hypothetical protein